MTDTILQAAGILAVVVSVGLGRRIVLAHRNGDGARLRFLIPQAVGLLLTSADVIVRQWGSVAGGVRAATGALFWAGIALVAYGLVAQFRAPRPKK